MTAHVRAISARETWPLRQRVLRPHQRLEDMDYAGDNHEHTFHLAAFLATESAPVCIASIYLAQPPDRASTIPNAAPAFQLRGMATAPEHAGTGLGSLVLRTCIDRILALHDRSLFWCNARASAAPFYQRHSLEIVSSPFDIPGIGEHIVMARTLERPK